MTRLANIYLLLKGNSGYTIELLAFRINHVPLFSCRITIIIVPSGSWYPLNKETASMSEGYE